MAWASAISTLIQRTLKLNLEAFCFLEGGGRDSLGTCVWVFAIGVEFSAGLFLLLIGYTLTVSSSETTLLSSDDDTSAVVGFLVSLEPPPWKVAEWIALKRRK